MGKMKMKKKKKKMNDEDEDDVLIPMQINKTSVQLSRYRGNGTATAVNTTASVLWHRYRENVTATAAIAGPLSENQVWSANDQRMTHSTTTTLLLFHPRSFTSVTTMCVGRCGLLLPAATSLRCRPVRLGLSLFLRIFQTVTPVFKIVTHPAPVAPRGND